MVIWIIGLSGVGKTTLSQLVYEKLKPSTPNLVRLDGDVIRNVFGNDVDHSVEGRLKNAERLSHLTKLLSDQGIHVIAAVLSIFPEWRKWNRENIHDYAEVYLKASIDTLNNPRLQDEGFFKGRFESTVIGDLFAFLLVDVLLDHFVSEIAGTDSQEPASPKVSVPKLFSQVRKL